MVKISCMLSENILKLVFLQTRKKKSKHKRKSVGKYLLLLPQNEVQKKNKKMLAGDFCAETMTKPKKKCPCRAPYYHSDIALSDKTPRNYKPIIYLPFNIDDVFYTSIKNHNLMLYRTK